MKYLVAVDIRFGGMVMLGPRNRLYPLTHPRQAPIGIAMRSLRAGEMVTVGPGGEVARSSSEALLYRW